MAENPCPMAKIALSRSGEPAPEMLLLRPMGTLTSDTGDSLTHSLIAMCQQMLLSSFKHFIEQLRDTQAAATPMLTLARVPGANCN